MGGVGSLAKTSPVLEGGGGGGGSLAKTSPVLEGGDSN